jgi:hypothetical protein
MKLFFFQLWNCKNTFQLWIEWMKKVGVMFHFISISAFFKEGSEFTKVLSHIWLVHTLVYFPLIFEAYKNLFISGFFL